MKRILLLLSATALFAACGSVSKPEAAHPVAVIFDTDMGNDIDDVLALQMLFNYEDAGKIDLLGITLSKSNPNTVPFLDGYCRFNNRNDVLIGYAYQGVNPEPGGYLLPTLADTLADGTPLLKPQRTLTPDIAEGYRLIRRLLVQQPDSSVVLIAVGPLTNIARLLRSEADEFSTLGGRDLVAQKVSKLCLMSGLYTSEFDFPEWNVVQDLPASEVVYKECPVEIVTSGWEVGNKLLYPHQSVLNDFGDPACHPLATAYCHYDKMPYDRQTWDLTTVLEALEPEAGYFDYSPRGTIQLDSIGKSTLIHSAEGKHRFLVIPDSKNLRTLNAIVDRTTGKNKIE